MANVELTLILCSKVRGCEQCDILLLEVKDPTKLIPFGDGRQRFFVESKIQSIVEIGCSSFEYKVIYDDAILADILDPLLPCDIKTVCCDNCRSRFLRSLVHIPTLSGSTCELFLDEGEPDEQTVCLCDIIAEGSFDGVGYFTGT